jgi:hypothetical protein
VALTAAWRKKADFDASNGGSMATLRPDIGMTPAAVAPAAAIRETAALATRFEAIVLDWDGGRGRGLSRAARLTVERLVALGWWRTSWRSG